MPRRNGIQFQTVTVSVKRPWYDEQQNCTCIQK